MKKVMSTILVIALFVTSIPLESFAMEGNTPVNTTSELKKNEEQKYGSAAIIGVYAIPGIGEVALLATGAVVLGGVAYGAGSWLGKKVKTWLASQNIANKVPNKLKKSTNYLDLSKFKRKNGKPPRWVGPLGWYLEKDRAGAASHGGSAWKLFNKVGKRIATIAADGKILRP